MPSKPHWRFGSLTIYVYADDHPPPHVHVLGRGIDVEVTLDSNLTTEPHKHRRRITEALQYIRDHTDEFWEAWKEYNERD